jgi:hypothetical protein
VKKELKKKILSLGLIASTVAMVGWHKVDRTEGSPSNADYPVTAEARAIPAGDPRFSHDLHSRGYLPVEIKIVNHSDDAYKVSRESTSLRAAPTKEVVWSVMKSSFPRSFAYKIAGFLFWPLAIPGVIDTVRSAQKSNKLTQEISGRNLRDRAEVLPPHATLERVIFFEREYVQDKFYLTIDGEGSETLTIPVDLIQPN